MATIQRTKTCPHCGRQFTTKRPWDIRSFCSHACANRARSPAPCRPIIDRLLERIEPQTNGCWLWMGATVRSTPKAGDGYGTISLGGRGGRKVVVHRVTYEYFIGPIPEGLELDHLCKTARCANPLHLEPVSREENMARNRNTHCRYGHPIDATPWGTRRCLTCSRAARRRYHAARRAAKRKHSSENSA